MKVPEKDSKGVFLVNRSLREHFRGVPDDFRGPEMNNRSAVELFRGLRKVSKGLERVRKGSKGLSRGQRVFLHARMKNASREDAKTRRKSEDMNMALPTAPRWLESRTTSARGRRASTGARTARPCSRRSSTRGPSRSG